MMKTFVLSNFVTIAVVALLTGCSTIGRDSPPFSIAAPALNKPHIILTADRSVVRKGESVQIMVTFVNPTGKQIAIPTEGFGDDGFDTIEHRLHVEWEGKNGNSSSGMSAVSLHPNPPSINYLAAGKSKSFRLRWKFDDRGEGVATLKYEFGWTDDFPPVEITIRTN
ncbi:MAG: hypothetical protein Q7Q71_14015 [Verrucomicrobiota bacterium JB023]|nr:hypothetical protein [Verrucomicrobiota bacterium JB023]